MKRAALLVLILLLAGPAWAGQSIGVAPFERSGSGDPPEIATLLADRLLTAGVACIGPDRLGVPAVAEPEPAQVQAWSKSSPVDAIVFGRVTGIGSRFSIDAHLRSARTGEVVSVHVTEIQPGGDVGKAVDELARKVLEGLAALDEEPADRAAPSTARETAIPSPVATRSTAIPSPVATRSTAIPSPVATRPTAGPAPVARSSAPARPAATTAPVSARSQEPAPAKQKGAKGLFGKGDGSPLRITSDDLEARQSGGARHMIFTDNVKATRGETTLTANRLDAFYPKGSNRPEKLVATGRVVMNNGDGEAHCQKMTYLEADQRVHCEGEGSELVRSSDRARGDKIEWDLETDTIYVKGNADILLINEEDGTAP